MSLAMKRSRRRSRPRDGCGFLLATCLFTCIFLVINGAIVVSFYNWFAPRGPQLLSHPKIAQAFLFIGPVVLIVVEWWLADFLVERLTGWRAKRRE